jgi:hypothetical protein
MFPHLKIVNSSVPVTKEANEKSGAPDISSSQRFRGGMEAGNRLQPALSKPALTETLESPEYRAVRNLAALTVTSRVNRLRNAAPRA